MNKMQDYKNLQSTLQEIFLNNLTFFKENHINLYDKIANFEKQNLENYSIEFNDNTFQLIDIKRNTHFYDSEPFLDSINRVNNFDFSSAFSLIKLDKCEKRNHYENEINAYEYINQFIENFKNINSEINKFIFIGTLLGVHINDFHNSIKAKTYLIIEPNIEIFRLSMFMTDYTTLAKSSKIFFAIEENEFNFKKIVNDFLDFKYEYNNLIHYELSHKTNESYINLLSLIFIESAQMRYPFSDYIISLKRGYKYFSESKNKILNLSKTYNFLEKENIIFLGAGPSLEKHIDWLFRNKDKFIIVAAAATLKQLELFNISPDIIITIDGQKEPILKQFNVSELIYKNSIILSSIKLDESVYEILKDTNIFFMQNSLEIFRNFGVITGVTVGDIGIDILLRLGAKNLYLLGIDAAIDSKTGQTHINTHLSSKKIDLEKLDTSEIDFGKTITYVKGNFEERVPTFLEYKEMIEEINNKFQILNKKFQIYNLSNGAYFKNTIPTKISQINITKKIQKESFNNIFISNLQQISKQNLDIQDIQDIKNEKEIIKQLILLDLEKDFIKEFENIKLNFLDSIVLNIFDKYLRLILPYYNFIKEKNISNKLLKNQISEILDKFNRIF